jgi:hypothetical protein
MVLLIQKKKKKKKLRIAQWLEYLPGRYETLLQSPATLLPLKKEKLRTGTSNLPLSLWRRNTSG